MSGCCPEPNCHRTRPISIYKDDFRPVIYAVTKSRVDEIGDDGKARMVATERHQVQEQLREFVTANRDWVLSVLRSGSRPDSPYWAPASKVFEYAHIRAEVQPGSDGDGGVGSTECGLPFAAEELWLPVDLHEGDEICRACRGISDEQGAMW